MPRGTRKRVVQCHDEYMSEEHIGQEIYPQEHAATPELQSVSSNVEEGRTDNDDDVDVNIQDENGETRKRGKTKLKDVWNLPKGLRIVVECNDLNQAIGEEAGLLGNFLGMVARNGCLCSLSYMDWRILIGKKESNTNEEKNKKDILEQVKMRFLYAPRMEKYVLRSIGEKWRQHKSNLKSLYFDAHKSMEVNYNNVPPGVVPDQWNALVNNWMSKKAQDISEQNRKNCAKKKSKHTAGSKSFARNREELRKQNPEKKNPHRALLYIHTHQPKSDKNINGHVGDLKTLLVQQPDLADTSQGKTAWKGDALNQILGADKPGRVHGLGLVPNPNQVFDQSTSRRLQNINLTSLDGASSEDVLSLRLQMEKFEKHVQNQDAMIVELKEKTKNLDRRQTNEESLDPVSIPRDAPHVDGQNSKRKRVYGDCSGQEFSMVEQQNNTMSKQNDFQDDDLQPPSKRSSSDKHTLLVADHEAPSYCSKHQMARDKHDVQNKKPAKGASATMLVDKQQRNTFNWLATKSMAVGTKVFLKSWKNANKDVALATIISCDPKYKLDGVQLGNEFWMVHVDLAIAKCEELIRPYKGYKLIGHAVGADIAWPSTYVDKING